jgi:hypothetical protein
MGDGVLAFAVLPRDSASFRNKFCLFKAYLHAWEIKHEPGVILFSTSSE